MRQAKLVVTKENKTGRNIEFQDTRNNRKMTNTDLISRLKTGNSSYNEDYYINTDKNGKKYVSSKPDGKEKNNLG